jgi:hypothetical protein
MAPVPKIVTLTLSEIVLGGNVGVMRQATNIRDRREHRYGLVDPEGFAGHIMGCHGEIALAKWRNAFWTGCIGKFNAADVGTKHQVRATTYSEGRLVVHEPPSEANNWRGDKPGDYFVCARVMLPQVHLVGWMLGRDAQDQKYWKALPARPNRPAFFVDNDDLHSMDDLPKIENAQEQAA